MAFAWLAFAAGPAAAETTEGLLRSTTESAAPAAGVETAIADTTDSVTASADSVASEAASVTEAAGAVAAAATSTSPPVAASAPRSKSNGADTSQAPPVEAAISSISDEVGAIAGSQTGAIAAVAESANRVVGAVEEISRDTSESVAATIERTVRGVQAHALRPAGEALRQAPLLGEQISKVTEPLLEMTAPVRGALASPLSPLLAPAIETLLPQSPLLPQSQPAAEALSGVPGFDAQVPAGPLSHRQATDLVTPSIGDLLVLGGVQPGANGHGPSKKTWLLPAATGVAFGAAAAGSAVERFGNPMPSDTPLPAPESPGAAAPGSAGSFFVPLAALLALLALVAPATRRRLREVPGFPAPTPFVCALERPG